MKRVQMFLAGAFIAVGSLYAQSSDGRKLMIPEMRFVCTKVYILQITKIILTTNTPTPPV